MLSLIKKFFCRQKPTTYNKQIIFLPEKHSSDFDFKHVIFLKDSSQFKSVINDLINKELYLQIFYICYNHLEPEIRKTLKSIISFNGCKQIPIITKNKIGRTEFYREGKNDTKVVVIDIENYDKEVLERMIRNISSED